MEKSNICNKDFAERLLEEKYIMENEIVLADEKSVNTSITTYDNQLLGFLNELGLPTQNILV